MNCESCYCKTCQYFKICEPCKNDYDDNKYSCNGERNEYCKKKCSELKEMTMDKWQKLKNFLTDGKEHITKDLYVSRPSVFEKILGIMEELDKRELSNSNIAQWLLVEEHIEDNILKQEFQCTRCGFTHTFFDGHTTQYKYCPSCGTRMKFIKVPNTGFTLYPN